MKACNNKHGTNADPFASKKRKKQSRPMGIMCYICGREYFSKSIGIHVEKCKEKWIYTESQKPKHERRKLPKEPTNFDDMATGKKTVSRDDYNDEAYKEYNESALVKCDGCSRTFLPDSLIKH